MWVDAHLHLDAPAFDADRDAVIGRAVAAGVRILVSAGTSIASSRRTIALAEQYPEVVAAVGIHPGAAAEATPASLAALREMVRHPRAVAVGEIGLDYYREATPRHEQVQAFRAQVRLAREVGLPVVVHDRDADADIDGILQDEGVTRVILHCFSGTPERALRCAAAGWTLSLAGPLTFARPSALREVAKCVPLDRVLVETDAPYLAPVPFRGRRCEPAFLPYTARALASLRELDGQALARQMAENARRLFPLIGADDA
ncbi:MAG TPA: TatD family hydrolase [bacterium]|nr:TatD family hydrolase [bacterium]